MYQQKQDTPEEERQEENSLQRSAIQPSKTRIDKKRANQAQAVQAGEKVLSHYQGTQELSAIFNSKKTFKDDKKLREIIIGEEGSKMSLIQKEKIAALRKLIRQGQDLKDTGKKEGETEPEQEEEGPDETGQSMLRWMKLIEDYIERSRKQEDELRELDRQVSSEDEVTSNDKRRRTEIREETSEDIPAAKKRRKKPPDKRRPKSKDHAASS